MLNSILGSELTLVSFLICTAVSLLLGVGTALVSMYRSRTTQSFAVTLAILPAVVQLVIMLVNGNLGAGVAVAGAFGSCASALRRAQRRRLERCSSRWPSALRPAWAMYGSPSWRL